MRGILPKGRAHLDDVGLGYFAHLARAFRIAGRLLATGLACLIHGIVPGLFTDRATRTVENLHRELSEIPVTPAPPLLGAAEAEA